MLKSDDVADDVANNMLSWQTLPRQQFLSLTILMAFSGMP
jgi:hypothetical protein